jgi:hypothetical protein
MYETGIFYHNYDVLLTIVTEWWDPAARRKEECG